MSALSASDRVGREDVVMFVNAAIASTAQREFRSSADGQRMSLDLLHECVLGNYLDLYAATLALDINHLNAAMITTTSCARRRSRTRRSARSRVA